MTLLRHPVVITSLEEDFRKIGLIKSDGRDEDDSFQNGLMESADDDADIEVDDDFDEDIEDVEDVEDVEDDDFEEDVEGDGDDALAEATAFNETFAQTWKSLGEDGVETVILDESEMAEMETLAEEVVELPAGLLPNVISEDDDLDEADEYDDDDDDDGDFDAEVEGDGTAFESVAAALRNVEALMEGPNVAGPEQAIPAFANMALIAEKLYGFFSETAEAQDDAEYAEISEAYMAIGKYSAGIVDTLQTEDPATIDMDVLGETFQGYLGTLLEGLETYALLREADAEGEEYDEDDEDDEYDEDDEGNG